MITWQKGLDSSTIPLGSFEQAMSFSLLKNYPFPLASVLVYNCSVLSPSSLSKTAHCTGVSFCLTESAMQPSARSDPALQAPQTMTQSPHAARRPALGPGSSGALHPSSFPPPTPTPTDGTNAASSHGQARHFLPRRRAGRPSPQPPGEGRPGRWAGPAPAVGHDREGRGAWAGPVEEGMGRGIVEAGLRRLHGQRRRRRRRRRRRPALSGTAGRALGRRAAEAHPCTHTHTHTHTHTRPRTHARTLTHSSHTSTTAHAHARAHALITRARARARARTHRIRRHTPTRTSQAHAAAAAAFGGWGSRQKRKLLLRGWRWVVGGVSCVMRDAELEKL